MLRESPSGKLKTLARLLFGGGNDAGGFPITNLGAPESPNSAARLADVTGGVAGAIRKYTVGPSWSGAEFTSIQAAIDQAVLDGHSTSTVGENVTILLYGVRFSEVLVIPEALPRVLFVGMGAGDVGSTINGSVTVNMPGATCNVAFESVEVIGNVVVEQPVRAANSASLRFESCTIFGSLTINSATAIGVSVQLVNSDVTGVVTATCRSFRASGNCRFQTTSGMTITSPSIEHFDSILGTGNSNAPVWNFNGDTGGTRLLGCRLQGRVNFTGASCLVENCFLGHAGSPAVSDACTALSVNQGNIYSHDAGAAGAAWVKSGTSLYHDGGNTYTEGQEYPWVQLSGTDTRTARAESDNELRRVLTLSGSNVLTAAQVGSQRKTTIAATTGGSTQTLPAISGVEPGCTVVLKDSTGVATATPLILAAGAGQTIDGAASVSITTNFGAVEVQQVSATNWSVIGKYL